MLIGILKYTITRDQNNIKTIHYLYSYKDNILLSRIRLIYQHLTDESFMYDNLLIASIAAWFSNDYNIVCFMLTSLDEKPCFSRLITQITFFLYIVILTFVIVAKHYHSCRLLLTWICFQCSILWGKRNYSSYPRKNILSLAMIQDSNSHNVTWNCFLFDEG